MVLLEWRAEFETGVPDVDHEHRELVALINELYDTMAAAAPVGEVLEYLGEIYARISAHFALEERLMREHDYDEYEPHKADHERLLDDLLELIDDYEADRVEDLTAFGARIDAWFTEHFRTRDARLHRRLGA